MWLRWETWLHGLVSAFVGGGATVVSAAFVLPEKVQFNDLNTVWKLWVASGVISVALYLKASPLPAIEDKKRKRK